MTHPRANCKTLIFGRGNETAPGLGDVCSVRMVAGIVATAAVSCKLVNIGTNRLPDNATDAECGQTSPAG